MQCIKFSLRLLMIRNYVLLYKELIFFNKSIKFFIFYAKKIEKQIMRTSFKLTTICLAFIASFYQVLAAPTLMKRCPPGTQPAPAAPPSPPAAPPSQPPANCVSGSTNPACAPPPNSFNLPDLSCVAIPTPPAVPGLPIPAAPQILPVALPVPAAPVTPPLPAAPGLPALPVMPTLPPLPALDPLVGLTTLPTLPQLPGLGGDD